MFTDIIKEFPKKTTGELYEHPYSSPLSRETHLTLDVLDCDSDYLLKEYVKDYYFPSLKREKRILPEHIMKTMNKIGSLEQDYKEVREELSSLNDKYRTVESTPDHVRDRRLHLYRMYRKIGQYIIDEKINLLKDIVRSAYVMDDDHFRDILIRIIHSNELSDYFSENMEWTVGDVDKSEVLTPLSNVSDKELVILASRYITPYELLLIYNPGENLPQYFHDSMVYMNYVQRVSSHNDPYEKELIDNKTLLCDDKEKVSEAVDVLVDNRKFYGWWA